MYTTIRRATAAALLAGSSFAYLPSAHAIEISNSPAPAQSDRPAEGAPSKIDQEPERKQFAVEANPLGVLIGHYSIQGEWMPAAHHALVLNPHFSSVSAELKQRIGDVELKTNQTFSGFGTELGYRFYTGSHGMNGFYIGPSLLLGAYSASSDDSDGKKEDVSFTSIGGAVDIGGQAVIGSGFVVGGGFGLQYTSVNQDFTDLPVSAAIIAGGGVRPRFLLSVGYAF